MTGELNGTRATKVSNKPKGLVTRGLNEQHCQKTKRETITKQDAKQTCKRKWESVAMLPGGQTLRIPVVP